MGVEGRFMGRIIEGDDEEAEGEEIAGGGQSLV